MDENRRTIVASFGSGRGNTMKIVLPKVVDPIPRLKITDTIIGYTCQFIYGKTHDIDYESIVVPVYLIQLQLKNKILAEYGVTRDSWYSRGIINDGIILDDFELTNRNFEPLIANTNLFSTIALEYPSKGLEAFALRQNGNENLAAEPHSNKMNTYLDGTPIDNARADLNTAKGVMIHIGGYYNNGIKNKLAGSYGCFGFIPSHQIGSKPEMEKLRKNNGYEKVDVANLEYKNFIKEVVKVRGSGELRVLIIKRNNIDKFKIFKNQ